MKMISLEMPKKKKSDKMEVCCPSMSGDKYPYGTRIELNDDIAKKFDGLKDMSIDDVVTIKGKAVVTRIEDVKNKDSNRFTIVFQMTSMAIEPDADGEMDDGFEKAEKE